MREELGFEGLVFTDAMTMKGFTSFTQTSTPHTDALLAGNDVLLFPGEPAATLDEIEGQVRAGRLDSALIAENAAGCWLLNLGLKPPNHRKASGTATRPKHCTDKSSARH